MNKTDYRRFINRLAKATVNGDEVVLTDAQKINPRLTGAYKEAVWQYGRAKAILEGAFGLQRSEGRAAGGGRD